MNTKVSLFSMTQCLMKPITSQDIVAYTARVSNPENQDKHLTGPRLVRHLTDNQHWSPLDMVDVTFEIKTTRDIARQLLRHRSFHFQEFSQRYAKSSLVSHARECRLQDEKNRQNSIETEDAELIEWWYTQQQNLLRYTNTLYEAALNKGIAKEVARVILPEGLTVSTLYMKGSLRSWYHYCALRKGNGTQKEHVEIVAKILPHLTHHYPDIFFPLTYRQ